MHMYTIIYNEQPVTQDSNWRGPHTATQDSDNNKVRQPETDGANTLSNQNNSSLLIHGI